MSLSIEQWRPIYGFEGWYEASDLGRVRSVDRTITYVDGAVRHYPARILRPGRTAQGYLSVMLCRSGVQRSYLVQDLVLRAFVGPRPPGPAFKEIRHLDGSRVNNRADNLAYGSCSENSRDAVRHGTHKEARKIQCVRGHPFDAANTYIDCYGRRICKTCRRRRDREKYARPYRYAPGRPAK